MREIKNFFGKCFPLISIIFLMALGTCSCANDKNSTNENVEIHVFEEDLIVECCSKCNGKWRVFNGSIRGKWTT